MPVARGRDQRHAVVVRVLGGGKHDLPDRGLLGQLLVGDSTRHVVGAGCAVVEPRVGVEAHVRHVEPLVAGIDERLHGLPHEEVARVLAGADVHDRRVRSDAGDADAVAGAGDDSGHVGAVTALVHVGGIDTGRRVARAVDVGPVDREVHAQLLTEVGRDVRMACVDAGVDDADRDALACGSPVRTVGSRADHRHVPLERGERITPVPASAFVAVPGAGMTRDRRLRTFLGEAVRHVRLCRADAVIERDAGDAQRVANLACEPGVVGVDQHEVDLGVPVDHGSTGGDDGFLGGEGAALGVHDDVFVARRRPYGLLGRLRCSIGDDRRSCEHCRGHCRDDSKPDPVHS